MQTLPNERGMIVRFYDYRVGRNRLGIIVDRYFDGVCDMLDIRFRDDDGTDATWSCRERVVREVYGFYDPGSRQIRGQVAPLPEALT